MKVLSIDPGLAKTGWVVLYKGTDTEAKLCDMGCISTSSKMPIEERLKSIYLELIRIIKKYKPNILVLEKQYLFQEAKSVLATTQARGVILLSAVINNIPVKQYDPKTVKIALTGYGNASKGQVQVMAKRFTGLPDTKLPDDISDALAVGICHLHSKDDFFAKRYS